MTKYEAKVISLESGLMHTLEGYWESAGAMEYDLAKDGYIVLNAWVAFNQEV